MSFTRSNGQKIFVAFPERSTKMVSDLRGIETAFNSNSSLSRIMRLCERVKIRIIGSLARYFAFGT